jgi:dTDP-4-dehydrorhamnose 3,5-epimerase
MKVHTYEIEGVLLIEPRRFHDARGFFSETYNADDLAVHGVNTSFVRDNVSLSTARGTVRGLHFQSPPLAQARLIRVARGAIFDVAVDIRAGSPTFGKHVGVELSAENALQLFVPAGFAHGFVTLRPLTEIAYKVSAPYSSEHDRGILWSDPRLRIAWPVDEHEAVLSAKDAALPLLGEIETPFKHCPAETEAAA